MSRGALGLTVFEWNPLAEGLEGLWCLFDEDDNGNNGEEYLTPEAIQGGYASNGDYYLSTLDEPTSMDDKIISELIYDVVGYAHSSSFYWQDEIEYRIVGDIVVVAVAYIYG